MAGRTLRVVIAVAAPLAFLVGSAVSFVYLLIAGGMADWNHTEHRETKTAIWWWMTGVVPLLGIACGGLYLASGYGFRRPTYAVFAIAAYFMLHGLLLPRDWLPVYPWFIRPVIR